MSEVKILENAGSLSENDMTLLTGTELIVQMMRNRLLVVGEGNRDFDWLELTEEVTGFYHIRSVDKRRLYQVWFEHGRDMDKFKQNMMVAKLSATAQFEKDK
jgi:hypothetical protein